MVKMTEAFQGILAGFAGRRIAVVGDAILDRYLIGESERLSREAPVPVLELQEHRQILGGAANPAANLAQWSAEVSFVTAIGADETGNTLLQLLEENGIPHSACITLPQRSTAEKTRILARSGLRSPQQLARLDRGARRQTLAAEEEAQLCDAIHQLPKLDALLCSDYGGGVLSARILEAVREKAKVDSALLTSDAQARLANYQGFDLVKCNAAEAAAELARTLQSADDFSSAVQELRQRLACGALVITRGAAGATLAAGTSSAEHIAAPAVTDVYDTVGAGDTTIAVLTLALVCGATPPEAVHLANIAGGIVVRHFGNYTPTLAEIRNELAR